MRTTKAILPAALSLALASACGSSPPTTYHALSPNPAQGGSAELDDLLVVSLSGFPQYLDRRELLRFSTPNTLELDEAHFWAEPFQQGFMRTLAEDLTALGHPAIPLGPLSRALSEPRTILLEIARFDTLVTGEIEVAATWIVQDASSDPIGPARRTHFTVSPKGKSSAVAIAAAQSEAVHALAHEIATALVHTGESTRP